MGSIGQNDAFVRLGCGHGTRGCGLLAVPVRESGALSLCAERVSRPHPPPHPPYGHLPQRGRQGGVHTGLDVIRNPSPPKGHRRSSPYRGAKGLLKRYLGDQSRRRKSLLSVNSKTMSMVSPLRETVSVSVSPRRTSKRNAGSLCNIVRYTRRVYSSPPRVELSSAEMSAECLPSFFRAAI